MLGVRRAIAEGHASKRISPSRMLTADALGRSAATPAVAGVPSPPVLFHVADRALQVADMHAHVAQIAFAA